MFDSPDKRLSRPFSPPALVIPSPSSGADGFVSAPNSAPNSPTAFGGDTPVSGGGSGGPSYATTKLKQLYGRIVCNLVAGHLFGTDALDVTAPNPLHMDLSLDVSSPSVFDDLPASAGFPVVVRAACPTEVSVRRHW